MSEDVVSCVQSAKGPIRSKAPEEGGERIREREVEMSVARVGQEAPDFEAAAYLDGGFKNIRLSDYRGQWVVLCFYPGDFTFV
jgi:hypothetical protein